MSITYLKTQYMIFQWTEQKQVFSTFSSSLSLQNLLEKKRIMHALKHDKVLKLAVSVTVQAGMIEPYSATF